MLTLSNKTVVLVCVVFLSAALAACGHSDDPSQIGLENPAAPVEQGPDVERRGEDQSLEPAVATPEAPFLPEGSPQALAVLAFLNDPQTDKQRLDIDAALDRRAAYWLVRVRNGEDRRFETEDDVPYVSIRQVEQVHFVGASVLEKLMVFAIQTGYLTDDGATIMGKWDGVTFTDEEAQATLRLVNEASFEELDLEASLNRQAVESITDYRPLRHVRDLAGLPHVGESALRNAREYAMEHYAHSLGH